MTPAVSVRGAGKRYVKYEDTPTLAGTLLRGWSRSRRSTFWAVRDIDLEVQPGETLGVVGRNGSGKSTLLQMLCGVTAPTLGSVQVRGRVAPLISVGVGFHPELTGRENVYVNGAILGMRRAEIDRRLEEIVAFSEIEDFIDTPVKFYSSGMFVRLGFAVAAHAEPDVLLVDEVLAVGDLGFQLKCYRHMDRLRERGTTVVLVTHNLTVVQRMCSRALVMSGGQAVFDGEVGDAVSAYYETLNEGGSPVARSGEVPFESGVLELVETSVVDAAGNPAVAFAVGERLHVRARVRALRRVDSPFVAVVVESESGQQVYREQNLFEPFPALDAGDERTLQVSVALAVPTGTYGVSLTVGRGTPGGVEQSRLADDPAVLVPPRQFLVRVDGRVGVHGVADLQGRFDGGA